MKTRTGWAARAVAGTGAAALVAAVAVTVAAPATAAAPLSAGAQSVTAGSGDLAWGFRSSFRNYVGQQIAALQPVGPVAVGQRITLGAPATFDTAGTPAWAASTSTPNETLPYLFPASGGSVQSADDLRIQTSGSVVYHFPSHAFTVTVKDVAVVVEDGTATIEGDLSVEIPESGAALGYTPGTYGGDDVEIGTVASADVDVDGDSVSVTGTGVALSAAGSAALQGFLNPGDALDGFTVSADLAAAPVTWSPKITVSKVSGFDPTGTEAVTVTGTGFDPQANLAGNRPPVASGKPTGVYVTFGRFADVWRPSAGAGSTARPVTSQKWALPEPSFTQVGTDYPSQADALVKMSADGSFTTTLDVKASTAASGNYGVYVYAAGGAAANAAQEIFVPIAFQGDISVGVDVPEGSTDPEPEPGVFSWTIGGSGAVSLGTAAASSSGFTAAGALPTIQVKDTREAAPAFSLAGQIGNFTTADGAHSFGGQALGWTPKVSANGAGAVAGATVAPGSAATAGLRSTSTLVSAAAGHALGEVTVGADLDLVAPADAAPGSYTATLTLTALS